MPHSPWSLQDAKNHFSAVVEAALRGDPQRVTRRGKPVAVVLSAEEYERLHRLDRSEAPSFTALLLDLPQDDQAFERQPLHQRDVEF
jgi:prevent-host-death family protein